METEKLIEPFQQLLDELKEAVKTYDNEYGALLCPLVEKGKQLENEVAAIQATRRLVGEKKNTAAEVFALNRPRAEAARQIVSDVELAEIAAAIPEHIAKRQVISGQAREIHNVFMAVIPKLESLAVEVFGITSISYNDMKPVKEEIQKIRMNLGLIKQE
jgi:hypothetical protein